MQTTGAGFTEKSFYLNEFRGRTLAVALSELEWPSLAPLSPLIDELSANHTRVVLLTPVGASLGELKDALLESVETSDWLGRLWVGLRAHRRVALELPGDGFAASCRKVALRMGVAKLVWLDPRGGLVRDDGSRVSVVDLEDLERLIAAAECDAPAGGDASLLREIRRMLEGGVPAVNLCSLDGLADELFTYAGSGTFFTRERYAEVRRLSLDDFDAAADLIARGVAEGYLVARSDEELEEILVHGLGVFIEGRYLAGIGALLPRDGGRAGEIASLYTLTRFMGEGVGGQLIRAALEWARQEGYARVFACTSSERVEGFFGRHGFRRVGPEALPAEKWRDYAPERRDRVRCLLHEV